MLARVEDPCDGVDPLVCQDAYRDHYRNLEADHLVAHRPDNHLYAANVVLNNSADGANHYPGEEVALLCPGYDYPCWEHQVHLDLRDQVRLAVAMAVPNFDRADIGHYDLAWVWRQDTVVDHRVACY